MNRAFDGRLWALGLFVAAGLAGQPHQALAASCRYSGNTYSSNDSICLDGFINTCQANGTWMIDRRTPCGTESSSSTNGKACQIRSNQTAARGAQACIDGKLKECGENGNWVDLGKGNC
jgi:hypothetical protein